MKRAYGIGLEAAGKNVAEGSFDDDGLLTLASDAVSTSDCGIVLERKLSPDALVYAVFVRKGGSVTAMSARSDVCFPGGRCRDFRDTMRFHIGSREFTAKVLRSERKAFGARAVRIIVFILMVLLIVVSGFSLFYKGERAAGGTMRVETMNSIEVSNGADELVREVRELMKVGKREQARLAVIERMERGDGGGELGRILEGLSKERGGFPNGKREGVFEKANEARRLFEDGIAKMQGGLYADAIRSFDESLNLVSRFTPETKFATSLEKARSDAASRLKNQLGGKLEALAREIGNSRKMGARRGTERLVRRYGSVGELAGLLAGDEEIEGILEGAQRAIESSSRRWLAAVRAGALHKGCRDALGEYGAIARTVGSTLPAVAAEARGEIARCGAGRSVPQ